MHIGMIVGIGPAATDYYYRYLISAMAKEGRDFQLTMAHADTQTLIRYQSENNQAAQVEIYLRLAERLRQAGAQTMAITSIAGHFCIDAFKKLTPLPVIDLLQEVKSEVGRLGLKRVGLLGTRVVMESRFFGVLDGVQVIPPASDLSSVHDAYLSMASAGVASEQHREIFLRAGKSLCEEHGCQTVMLAGTDLTLVFKQGFDPGFPTLDCASIHSASIAREALRD